MDATKLKKITIKEVLGFGGKTAEEVKKEMLDIARSKKNELMVIAGDMVAYGGKATQYGESFFVGGTIVAQNRKTGEVFAARKAYLPKDITEELQAAFDSRKGDGPIGFNFIISVVEDKKSGTGYSYVSEPIKNPEVINREAELLATFKALPAPKKS